MPKILRGRPAQDQQEERQVRKLATIRHGSADWIQHAKMVVRSWEGWWVEAIAADLHCDARRCGGGCIASMRRGSTGWVIGPDQGVPGA